MKKMPFLITVIVSILFGALAQWGYMDRAIITMSCKRLELSLLYKQKPFTGELRCWPDDVYAHSTHHGCSLLIEQDGKYTYCHKKNKITIVFKTFGELASIYRKMSDPEDDH